MNKLLHIFMTLCLLSASVAGMTHISVSASASAMPMAGAGISHVTMDQMMADCDDCAASPQVADACDIICAVPAVIARKDPLENLFSVKQLHILPVAHRAAGITRRPEIAPPRLLS
ncbi:hypothetical protein [Thalassospira tepidiphila]|uniref:Uncharacterized protein n=2 Tax=Thalassospira tepidiphila TaxID=393657 RepID=A0A853L3M2_9PROT|nr:hypothetical protein [Thalassospira tepidiphila]NJB73932.1 hypothetical protein [Thalassospira tepidiphila]OAZ11908.1 hypothetical protein TH4_02175 [Thalassospira tepidiphila MCCC 1A03514]